MRNKIFIIINIKKDFYWGVTWLFFINFSQRILLSLKKSVSYYLSENPLGQGSVIWIDILQKLFNLKYPNVYLIALGTWRHLISMALINYPKYFNNGLDCDIYLSNFEVARLDLFFLACHGRNHYWKIMIFFRWQTLWLL